MNIVILASGFGSNLQALIDDQALHSNYRITGLITNNKEAYCIKRAIECGIRYSLLPHKAYNSRDEYDSVLENEAKSYKPDLIVLAGWDRILSANFVRKFTIINLHPALPGKFPGTIHAVRHAFDEFKAGKLEKTGVMVHYVSEEVDTGPVIMAEDVAIYDDDTLEILTDRIHIVEHRLIVASVHKILEYHLSNASS